MPVTSYGEFEGLRLPVRVTAVWKLAEGDREDIDVTLTDLRYDTWPKIAKHAIVRSLQPIGLPARADGPAS